MGSLKRAKDAGFLFKLDSHSMFCITERLIDRHIKAANRLFGIKAGLTQFFFSLTDTGSKANNAEWYAGKISLWLGTTIDEAELIDAVLELTRLGYFRLGVVETGIAGQACIRYEPSSPADYAAVWEKSL